MLFGRNQLGARRGLQSHRSADITSWDYTNVGIKSSEIDDLTPETENVENGRINSSVVAAIT
ncbi:hypothetical protein J6590_019458 [Homalodisca vitripennis]|nr:hypothetical protein J6590_019458 [Homalodisca vitripennis]